MTVTNSTWFTGPQGCIGIVQIDTVVEETRLRKNYIGVGCYSNEIGALTVALVNVANLAPPVQPD